MDTLMDLLHSFSVWGGGPGPDLPDRRRISGQSVDAIVEQARAAIAVLGEKR